MFGVLLAERAVLGKNQSVRIVLFVLNTVVVSMLAFRTFKRDFRSSGFNCHNKNSIQKITPLFRVRKISLTHFQGVVNLFCLLFLSFFGIFKLFF